jgi:predicted RNA-binding protein with PIN domain
MPRRAKELIVDGYNVIRTSPKYRALVDEEILDPLLHDIYIRARTSLISDVAAFAKGRYDATIVFDGFGNLSPERPQLRSAGVQIVFSEEGEEADAVIERMVHEGRRRGHEIVVVTGDQLIQNTVMGDGVTRMSSRMFSRETAQMNRTIYEERVAPNHRQHSTVADHLSPEVREKLWLMAQGKWDPSQEASEERASAANGRGKAGGASGAKADSASDGTRNGKAEGTGTGKGDSHGKKHGRR